ncbi:hypothetical protein KI387_029685, partial [Taxus chinensis]
TNPSVDNSLQVVKCLTMGDSAMAEDRLLELLGEPGLEACFKEEVEEAEEIQLENVWLENEKGKLVYVINGEEAESLDVNHSMGMCEVVESVNAHAHAYFEPLKSKK